MNIGKSIKIALINAGKSQNWLAEKMGRFPQSVNRLANSKSATGSVIKELADIFEMPSSKFVALGEE